MRRTLGVGILIGVAGLAALAATASGAPGPPWSAADSVSAPGQSAGAGVARLDPRGNGWVVYNECNGLLAGPVCNGIGSIRSRVVRGGSLGPPTQVARGVAQRFILELDGNSAILHWLRADNRWQRARTNRDRRFGSAGASRPPEGGGAFVTENARGQALSVYTLGPQGLATVWAAYRNGSGAPWQRARRIGRLAALAAATGAIDARGRASVFWASALPAFGGDSAVQPKVSDRLPNGRFRTGNVAPASVAAIGPAFAANSRGDQVATWSRCTTGAFGPTGCTGPLLAEAARRPSGNVRFARATTLPNLSNVGPRPNTAGPPAPILLSNRRAIVVWQDLNAVWSATARPTGGWTRRMIGAQPGFTAALPGALPLLGPVILVGNPRGQLLASWTRLAAGGLSQEPVAAIRQRSGIWRNEAPLDAGAPFVSPPVASVNDSGRALALWLRGGVPPDPQLIQLRYATNRLG